VAAERLGFQPSTIAVFEDSSAGIRAGHAAGMHMTAVPNPHFPPTEEALGQAGVVLDSLMDFTPDVLSKLSA